MPTIRNLPILIPSRRSQDRIAAALGILDDKIELNTRMAETLEAMVRALFKSWFVDFDPVHARSEGRSTGLPDDLASLFPDSFGEGALPNTWHVVRLSDLAELDRGTCNPAEFCDEMVAHYSIPAFDEGRRPVMELANSIKSLKLRLMPPVVLFSKLNPETPRIWPLLAPTDAPGLASTEYLAFRPAMNGANFTYLAGLLSSKPFADRAAAMVTGTSNSHQRVQAASLLATEWLRPPQPIMTRYEAVAGVILARADAARRESDTLAALRDTLLPKLTSGELRISDAELQIAAA